MPLNRPGRPSNLRLDATRGIPAAALALAIGTLFAPPVFGMLGVIPPPAHPRSALTIETLPEASLGPATNATARPNRRAQLQCPAVNLETAAPRPPLRTIVAELDPALVPRAGR